MFNKIKIKDVILHKNQYCTQTMIVLNRMPDMKYEKNGQYLIGEDSGFYNFYKYEKPTKMFQAFAGRKFDIPMKDGSVIEANGQWWDCLPPEYQAKNLISPGISTKEKLEKCYVFYGAYYFDKTILDKWLKKNSPSNNYYKYEKRNKNYMVQIIKSKFDTKESPDKPGY